MRKRSGTYTLSEAASRLASNCQVTIQLEFKDPIRRTETSFCDFRHHGWEESWKGLFGHFSERAKLTQKDALNRCLDWLQRYAAGVLDYDLWARFDPAFSRGAIFCFATAQHTALARTRAMGRSQPDLLAQGIPSALLVVPK